MMNNERELLTLAAKALGIPLAWSSMEDLPPRRTDTWANWNPRDDDGDGARMEAALGINIEWMIGRVTASVSRFNADGLTRKPAATMVFGQYGDRNAARRCASLQVATAIGEAMP